MRTIEWKKIGEHEQYVQFGTLIISAVQVGGSKLVRANISAHGHFNSGHHAVAELAYSLIIHDHTTKDQAARETVQRLASGLSSLRDSGFVMDNRLIDQLREIAE